MYPILWAVEHAPVADAEERAILVALVTKGDFDGCNCYRGFATLAKVARVDRRTAMRKVQAMTERGLMRAQPGPKPKSWLDLPKDKRPVVREVLVPASFWSAVQLEEINEGRAERGRPPITPEVRPDLPPAPPKQARADKGKPNPKRSRKKKSEPDRGVSESPRPEGQSGVSESHPAECLEVTPRGVSESPNPPRSPSDSPSSPPAPPDCADTTDHTGTGPGGEDNGSAHEENGAADARQALLERAHRLTDAAVRRWGTGHRAPGAHDRQRLAERVADELVAGGVEDVILDELTRDLATAKSAVSVVLGARTAKPGWGRVCDPRPDHSRYEPAGPKPPWCGLCSETTRLVAGQTADGGERLWRCSRCHPNAVDPAAVGDDQEPGSIDPDTVARMQASLQGAPTGQSDNADGDGMSAAAQASAEEVRAKMAADRAKAGAAAG